MVAGRVICASGAVRERGPGVRFALERHGVQTPAFVIRIGGQVRAYLNQCAHVPVELDWQPGEFFDDAGLYLICATHGALYAPESGRCVGGRCNGRGLVPVPVEERDGNVFLLEVDGKS